MSGKWEQDWERREQLYEEQLCAYIEFYNALKCTICFRPGEVRVLTGGRRVALCPDCTNAWVEYIDRHELAEKWNVARADYEVAIHQRTEEVARDCLQAWNEISIAMYELSGEWLKEEIVKWKTE